MSQQTPAGWYPDPADPSRTKWWDGTQWTDHVAPATPAAPAAPAWPAAAPAAPGAPAWPAAAPAVTMMSQPTRTDINPNNVWIWLVVAVSTLPVFAVFLYPWQGLIDDFVELVKADRAGQIGPLPMMGGGILLISLGSFVLLALSILFSYLDWRDLRARGIEKPFHWGFAFIALVVTVGVYVIGRCIVVKRVTGRGLAPMWAWIVLTVAAIIALIVFAAWLINAIVTGVGPLTR